MLTLLILAALIALAAVAYALQQRRQLHTWQRIVTRLWDE